MVGIHNVIVHNRDSEGDYRIEVDPTKEIGIDIIENEGVNMLTHYTFVSMDDNALVDIHDVPLNDKAQKPHILRCKDKSSLYYFGVGQLEGTKWYFKHMYDIDSKVCKMISHINISFCLFFVIVIYQPLISTV